MALPRGRLPSEQLGPAYHGGDLWKLRRGSVALCLIAKDEAHNLPGCLASVKEVAAEILVVDTGSQDGTPELARNLGAQVISFPWRHDFAAARNAGIDRSRSEWILVLDADERLAPGGASELRGFVESEASARVAACGLVIVSYTDRAHPGECEVSHNIRLFRNLPGHRYRGAVHEQVLDSVRAASPGLGIVHLPTRILHHGYLASAAQVQTKARRNLDLIQAQLAQMPEDSHLRYHAGVCLYNLGRLDEAIQELRWVVERGDRTMNYAARAAKLWVMALANQGRHEEARAVLDRWQATWPGYTDLEYMRALVCRRLGDLSAALRSAERCMEMGPSPPPYDADPGAASHKAARVAGDLHCLLGNRLPAERAYRRVAPGQPGYAETRVRLLMLYEQRFGLRRAMRRLFSELPDGQRSSLMAEICALAGLAAEGLAYARRAPRLDEARRELLIARCLLAGGDAAGAAAALARIAGDSGLQPEVQRLRCSCAVALGDRDLLDQAALALAARAPKDQSLIAAAHCLLGDPTAGTAEDIAEGLPAIPGLLQEITVCPVETVLRRAATVAAGQGGMAMQLAAVLLGACRRPDLAWQAYISAGGGARDLRLEQRIQAALGRLGAAVAAGEELLNSGTAPPDAYLETSRLYTQLALEVTRATRDVP